MSVPRRAKVLSSRNALHHFFLAVLHAAQIDSAERQEQAINALTF